MKVNAKFLCLPFLLYRYKGVYNLKIIEMSIYFPSSIYAIVRGSDGRLSKKTFSIELEQSPSSKELRRHFNYAFDLRGPYTSCLPFLTEKEDNFLSQTREYRKEALAYEETANKIKKEYDVIALSHRQGGWTTFTWEYNEDIKFEIYSNFGFGSCSELLSRFFYKGMQLTPYSEYVKYRYAGYSQLIRYTYCYQLQYRDWDKLMNDTLEFYNAVEKNEENEVFNWLKNHLNGMVSGLEKLYNAHYSYTFENINSVSNEVTSDELIIVKAEKIGGATDFISNIENLPEKVNPHCYAARMENLFTQFRSYSSQKRGENDRIISQYKQELKEISSIPFMEIYDRLRDRHYFRDNWSYSSNHYKMIRYLMKLHARLGKPYDLTIIRETLKKIEDKLGERNSIQSMIFSKERVNKVLLSAEKKINEYQAKKEEEIKTICA